MTLPFQKPNDGERLFCCFVCGLEFKEYEAFKAHIIEKHQEGRDYVRCPLQRCQAVVRDVRAHYRAIHRNEPIPSGVQMKAIVWVDQRDPKSKKKKRKMSFNDGDFTSHKNGKKLHYRSGYELEVYKCLEQLPEVVRFDAEPFGIPYWFAGEKHMYFPDLLVQFADGSAEVWEIKPKSQTSYEVNEAKWTAAANYCEARGWKFEVKTEKGIQLLREEVKRR